VDAVDEGLLTRERALLTVEAGKLDELLHPLFDPAAPFTIVATGVPASPGAASGEVVFSAHDAVAAAAEGRKVVLCRPFTEADDVAGFHAAVGILTAQGGKASHAALVARGMGRPCVAGASSLDIDDKAGEIRLKATGELLARAGDHLALDGSTGAVTTDEVPLIDPPPNASFQTVLGWADELRRLEVRANADTPRDARTARAFGAQGIGLCRTEHMFMAADRVPKMQAMILADEPAAREAALEDLLPLQQGDFEGLFEEMRGLPVTIRLLDPPLHEFLPARVELELELAAMPAGDARRAELEHLLVRVKDLAEANPMLGTRGARLGLLHPEI